MSGYDGDHVEIHGTFHDKVFGKVGTYIEHYHPPAAAAVQSQIVEGVIPQQPRGFQPREELVRQLDEQVAQQGAAVVCALTGTPGVGKTLLAASYAWACQAAGWPLVAWIAAETEDQILAGLDALAARLGVRSADDDAVVAAGRAKAWLAGADRPCLVVFDNAAQVEVVRRWCPATGATRVVITSRNRAFHRHYPPVEVEVFTPDQARAFLTERTGLSGEAAAGADELAEEVGYLPLALAQAAALIAWKRLDYRAYLHSLRAFPLGEYLSPLPDDPYPAGVAQAILLSVTQVATTVPGARAMLERLAVLSPAGVSRLLLYGTPVSVVDRGSTDKEHVGTHEQQEARVDEVVAQLADASLVTFSEDGSTVLMHRLVQRVLRERAQHESRLTDLVLDATTLLHVFNTTIPDGAKTWGARAAVEMLHEHTNALYALASTADTLSPELIVLRSRCGQYLADLADLDRAIDLQQQVQVDCERVLGTDHPGTLMSRNNLAGAYRAAGRVSEAITLYEVTLAAQERVLGADHPGTLMSRNNLAGAYRAVGRVSEAITLYLAMLADCERVLGADHPGTLTSRNNLAFAYQEAGRVLEAITLHEATLADRERVLGADHPDTLSSRNNLALAYQQADRVSEAITLFEATLADCERVLGADHPGTLISRSSLAGAYQKAGEVLEAITLFETTLVEQDRVLGADHLDTLNSRNNLALAYQQAGRVPEAITLFEATLADRERVLSANHPDTLISRSSLAGAYQQAGRVSEAITLYEVMLADRERVLGADHPDTLASRSNLAGAYQQASRVSEAITLRETTLAGCERLLGADHPDTLVSRNNLASAYQQANRVPEAITLYEATLAGCERVLGADHPTTRIAQLNLDGARAAMRSKRSWWRYLINRKGKDG